MNLEKYKQTVLRQAKEKGWGSTSDKLSVPEKIVLIHVEISEAYQAFLKSKANGRHGFNEELADVLQRTLHLGGAFGIDFSVEPEEEISIQSPEKGFLLLHKAASEAYEYYRHKEDSKFQQSLLSLAYILVEFSKFLQFDLESAFLEKFQLNKKRTWNPQKLRGTYGVKE